MTTKSMRISILIFLVVLVFYSPILLDLDIILNRGNDLSEQFWPVFYYIRKHLLSDGELPFWNNLFLSGTPLLSDPQFSLFYPGNFLFFLLPTDLAFLAYFILHSFIGGIGAYLLAKRGLGISLHGSFLVTALYISAPRFAGYLEAGHYGLVGSQAWVPFTILAALKLVKVPKVSWSVMLGVSLAGLFFTHTVNLVVIIFGLVIFFIVLCFYSRIQLLRFTVLFLVGGIICFALTAVTFLPQLAWLPTTTRFLLLKNRDIYPVWESFGDFFKSIFPTLGGINHLYNIETEKWLYLGVFPLILAFIGFMSLRFRLKVILALFVIVVVSISLSNISPFWSLLIKMDWFVLMRVLTRTWILVVLTVIFLAGLGYEVFERKNTKLAVIFAILAIAESLVISWLRISRPMDIQAKFVLQEVYEFLGRDKDRFRVYCTNRCLSQKEAAIWNIELVEGYNTVVQKNYYQQAWQLTGAYWDYYTLSIPPLGIYMFENAQPDPVSLGNFNTKYIISPYSLSNNNFIERANIGKYVIYENAVFKSRAYFLDDNLEPSGSALIDKYSPNYIKINTQTNERGPGYASRLVLAEVFSPGWGAFLNGETKVDVLERPDRLRMVNLETNTRFVEFKYNPPKFILGMVISLTTVCLIVVWFSVSFSPSNSFKKHQKYT